MSKISELSNGGALLSTDDLIVVRSGGNVRAQLSSLNGITIGSSTPAAGSFTTLQASTSLNVNSTASFSYLPISTAGSVVGSIGTGSSVIFNTPSVNSSYGSGLAIDGSYSSDVSTINIKAFGPKFSSYSSQLAFHTSSGTSLTEVMRIKGSNVGIGTSSPAKKLHIYDATQANQSIRFGNPASTPYGEINYDATGFEHLYIDSHGTTTGYGNIVFRTGPTPDEAMRITSSGSMIMNGAAGTSPIFEMINNDNEDTDTGRETSLRFSGHRSGGEDVVNAQISAHHDGSADDDKGMLFFYTNNGSGLNLAQKIDNGGNVAIPTQVSRLIMGAQGADGDVHFGSSGMGAPSSGNQDYGFYAAHNAYRTSTGAWKHSRDSSIPAVRLLGSGGVSSGNNGFSFDHSANVGSSDISWTNLMNISTEGAVTKPKQPAFSVSKNSAQSDIATSTDVTVTWPTEIFDVGSDFSGNTFTAPVTGKYQLNLMLRLDNVDSAAAYYIVSFFTSNRHYRFIAQPGFTGDLVYNGYSVSVLADMDANDTVYVTVNQGAGTSQTDIAGDVSYQNFSGYLVA